MTKNRLEAFSDGVIAIIITIMVLEIKVPHGQDFEALKPLLPVALSYILSFIYLGIYWNNHHHMLHTIQKVSGGILWANLHLLFWLSLIPFATGWIGRKPFRGDAYRALWGNIVYVFYSLLDPASLLVARHDHHNLLARAVGKDLKGKISPILYLIAIGFAFVHPFIASGIYTIIAIMWLIPDRRIETTMSKEEV